MRPADLPGWAYEDHVAALRAYQAACRAARDPRDRAACAEARSLGRPDEPEARRFFETRFIVEPAEGEGLLTGYFAPEYEARPEPDEIFSAPVKPKPAGLVRGPNGRFGPYLTRAEIETSAGPALAYMRPEDLFFLQIQGSGYLAFPDGRRARAAYAADNGRPFTAIARPMASKGLLPPGQTTGDSIHAWLAEHRGPEADAVIDLNERYVFFSVEADDDGEPRGSAGIPLLRGRAVAIDAAYHDMGELLWLDTGSGASGGDPAYRRLVVALDEGGAIKGPARADLYLGRGETAGTEAGRIRLALKLYRLRPER
jgi:membrane-bound lytic murein transglycosylase A